MPDYFKILIPSVIGLVTTVVAAFLSARWAVRRAFEERWWSRKEQTYTEIIEALHDLIRFSSIRSDDSPDVNDNPKFDDFAQRYQDAYWRIQKATDIGPFVISDEAAKILDMLRNEPILDWSKNPPWEVRKVECNHYRDALAGIRKCARKDLKI